MGAVTVAVQVGVPGHAAFIVKEVSADGRDSPIDPETTGKEAIETFTNTVPFRVPPVVVVLAATGAEGAASRVLVGSPKVCPVAEVS